MSSSSEPRSLARMVVIAGALTLVSACRTKLNPSLDGFVCNDQTGICFAADGGLDAGPDADAGADAETGADADAGLPSVLISSPSSPTYANGTVVVNVSVTSSATPDEVVLLKNDAQLAQLTPPSFTYSWDTTAEMEGAYALTARAQVGGKTVTSLPVTVVVDRTPPSVILDSRVPAPGASEVSLTDPVQVVFSEAIVPTLAQTAVALAQSSGAIATKTTLSSDGKTLSVAIADRSKVSLSPDAPSMLSATVSSSVTDLAGNAIVAPPQWSWSVPLWLDLGSVLGGLPSLALDGNGAPFVSTAYEPGAIGSRVYNLQVSRHVQAKTWDTSLGSPQTAGSLIRFGNTSVAVGSDGHPIVAWSQEPMSGPPASIHVARWTGTAWDTSYPVLDDVQGSATDTYTPSLAAGPSNALFVAWAEVGTNSVTDVHSASWTGTAWNPLPPLGVIGASNPAVVVGPGGQPIIGWITVSNMSGVSTWSAQSWSTSNYPSSYSSSLALDKDHRPVVTFADGNTVRLRYVDANAEEYAPAISAGNQPANPKLAIDSQDRAVVVWTYSNGGTRDVRVARWTGTEWDTTFGSLSASSVAGSDAATPVIAIDGSDAPIIAWQELDPVRSATYVRKSNR